MKKVLFLLSVLFVLFSCGDKEDKLGSIELNFKLTYQGEPLVMTPNEVNFHGLPFKVSRVSFFLSDMQLVDGLTSTDILEVAYINPTDAHIDLASAQQGLDYKIDSVPVGNYSGLAFNIGLDAAKNGKLPSNYPTGHLLSEETEYWADWKSYIFIKIEGLMDFDGDGVFSDGITMHLGSDDAMVSASFDKNIEVIEGGATTLNFELDLFDVFDQGGEVYDFRAVPRTHTLDFIDEIKFVAQGVAKALKLL